MFSQQLGLLDGLIKISNPCTGQLYLIGKASNAVTTFCGQHHGFNSFSGAAQKVAVLFNASFDPTPHVIGWLKLRVQHLT
jgi:hypothetical protein